jgi:hypothetical protein
MGLDGNCEIIYGRQALAGKILSRKELRLAFLPLAFSQIIANRKFSVKVR